MRQLSSGFRRASLDLDLVSDVGMVLARDVFRPSGAITWHSGGDDLDCDPRAREPLGVANSDDVATLKAVVFKVAWRRQEVK